MRRIGELIKRARVSRNMTQREVAHACGVSIATISLWEQGHTKPRDDRATQLAKILDISVDAISIGLHPDAEQALTLLRRMTRRQRQDWLAIGRAMVDRRTLKKTQIRA